MELIGLAIVAIAMVWIFGTHIAPAITDPKIRNIVTAIFALLVLFALLLFTNFLGFIK